MDRSEYVMARVNEAFERIGDSQTVLNGPVLAVDGVDLESFKELYKSTRMYKFKPLWQEDKIFLQFDGSIKHSSAAGWLLTCLISQLHRLSVPLVGPDALVSLTYGGMIEVVLDGGRGTRMQEIEVLLLERKQGESFETSKPIVIGQVCSKNKSLETMLDDMNILTDCDRGAKLAIGLFVHPFTRDMTIAVKFKSAPTMYVTGTWKCRWDALFEQPRTLGQVGSRELELDFNELDAHIYS